MDEDTVTVLRAHRKCQAAESTAALANTAATSAQTVRLMTTEQPLPNDLCP
ncbi:hypothetical protein ACIBI9_52970 [Nonomuraea sp. NPDC050451]|uniref:hypothetical protein n=1 Tax=Nonomuraea sp. NPDC050451 TaxID=3364364 RepID=UPI0037B10A35